MPAGLSPATAIATKDRTPAAAAAPTATRSANIESPYDGFSTLAPVKTRPSAVSKAAPTRNCEYGAYAHNHVSHAFFARDSICALSILGTDISLMKAAIHGRGSRAK